MTYYHASLTKFQPGDRLTGPVTRRQVSHWSIEANNGSYNPGVVYICSGSHGSLRHLRDTRGRRSLFLC